jgi:hypothetical protein
MVVHRRVSGMAAACSLVAWMAVAPGCNREPDDRTPSGALRLFVTAMERSEHDARALEDAYRLLAPDAREALAERARRAESLAGREMKPADMLVQGRFRVRVPVSDRGELVERVEGDRAVVVVPGAGETGPVEVPMVKDGDRWRVVLEVPSLIPP